MVIRQRKISQLETTIIEAIEESGLTQKELAAKSSVSQGLISLFLERDITKRRTITMPVADRLCTTLGLVLKFSPGQPNLKKGIAMKAEKPKSFRGRIIAEWKKLGKPNWNLREQIGMSLLIDFDFRIEGSNPAEEFRKAVDAKDYGYIKQWVGGLKFKTWE